MCSLTPIGLKAVTDAAGDLFVNSRPSEKTSVTFSKFSFLLPSFHTSLYFHQQMLTAAAYSQLLQVPAVDDGPA